MGPHNGTNTHLREQEMHFDLRSMEVENGWMKMEHGPLEDHEILCKQVWETGNHFNVRFCRVKAAVIREQ